MGDPEVGDADVGAAEVPVALGLGVLEPVVLDGVASDDALTLADGLDADAEAFEGVGPDGVGEAVPGSGAEAFRAPPPPNARPVSTREQAWSASCCADVTAARRADEPPLPDPPGAPPWWDGLAEDRGAAGDAVTLGFVVGATRAGAPPDWTDALVVEPVAMAVLSVSIATSSWATVARALRTAASSGVVSMVASFWPARTRCPARTSTAVIRPEVGKLAVICDTGVRVPVAVIACATSPRVGLTVRYDAAAPVDGMA